MTKLLFSAYEKSFNMTTSTLTPANFYNLNSSYDYIHKQFPFAATAVDSRLEFSEQTPLRYTLLVGKAFPRLPQFTIAFWIKVYCK